jgi:hypothetical protein
MIAGPVLKNRSRRNGGSQTLIRDIMRRKSLRPCAHEAS